MAGNLDQSQLETFQKDGYLVFEGLFSAPEIDDLKNGVELLRDEYKTGKFGGWPPAHFLFEIPELGRIVVHEKILAIVEDLLGPGYYFHHLHAAKHEAGAAPANWHQDYEQVPQSNRTYGMVHVFYYLNGLNGEVGDLMLVPGSQNSVIDRGAIAMFGTSDLPGSIVFDKLAPGSAVVVHSAVWHARRAKPGGETTPRYFIDASYCQAGIRWPGYPGYEAMCSRAFEIGLVSDENHGHLFTAENYFDGGTAGQLLGKLPGSLALHAKEWAE